MSTFYVIGKQFNRISANARLVLYAGNTNSLPVVKDINEFQTALVMKQPEAWLFENMLFFNTVKCVLYYFLPVSGKNVDKPIIIYKDVKVKKKVNQSRYRPGVAQRVPGS
jgi:hypothetical protein